jgi:transcriptional regulator with XRE-family HTH domain
MSFVIKWYYNITGEALFMVQRLKEVRKALGLNQTEFAKHLGITQTAYSMIESGNRPLADKYIKVICSAFNVSETWFLTGDGEMFVSSPYEKEFTDIFGHLAPETQQYLLLMAKELLNTQQKLLNPNSERPKPHSSEK